MATSEPERVASLAAAFRQLDPHGAGRVPYAAVVQMLNSGEWDLSATGGGERPKGGGGA